MTVYPLPPRACDERFDDGLVNEVAVVLELRGFPPVRTGSDRARLRDYMFGFLYEAASGSSAYSDPRSPDGEGVPAPTLPRPAPTVIGRGPGTPDDWPDKSWMDPHHDLTQYGPLGERIDYPQMCSGTYSYAALKTWGNQ